jgi:hypothetical protein
MAQQLRHSFAQVLVGKATGDEPKVEDRREQCEHARVAEAQTRRPLFVDDRRLVDLGEGVLAE